MPLPILLALLTFDDTPEKTVQGFVDAINAHDSAGSSRRVVGMKNHLPKGAALPPLKVRIGKSQIEGDEATVEIEVEAGFRSNFPTRETVALRRTAGDWQIVPRDGRIKAPGKDQGVVGAYAFVVANPQLFAQAKAAALKSQSLSNVKQIAIAALLYANDHRDRLPNAANFRAAVRPYLKDEAVFAVPGMPKGSATYFMDPRLSGRSLTSIPSPSQTAMVLLGTPKETMFPYAGTTILGYADGHVKAATPEIVVKARKAALP